MIKLMAYSIVKGGDQKKQVGMPVTIQKWSNDAFYEKFDIFDEKEWAKFIVNYRKFGKGLAPKDPDGNYYAYAIIVHGTDQLMREHFTGDNEDKRSHVFVYLFPQETSMNGKTEKLIAYNKKYIYPHLK